MGMWTPTCNGVVSYEQSLVIFEWSSAEKLIASATVRESVCKDSRELQTEGSPVAGSPHTPDSFVELKTSMTIRGSQDEARFEKLGFPL